MGKARIAPIIVVLFASASCVTSAPSGTPTPTTSQPHCRQAGSHEDERAAALRYRGDFWDVPIPCRRESLAS